MNASNNTSLNLQPRFEAAGPLLIAGLREPLDEHAAQKIPQLWQQLINQWPPIPQRVSNIDYGLCIHLANHEYYYMAGYAVWDFDELPSGLSAYIVPSQTYAVFVHPGHVSGIRATLGYLFNQWLPGSGYKHSATQANSLHFFERYGEGFNPQTGEGDIEIWLPVTT
jgi:AraC family transcriptional regulator